MQRDHMLIEQVSEKVVGDWDSAAELLRGIRKVFASPYIFPSHTCLPFSQGRNSLYITYRNWDPVLTGDL